MKNWIKLAGLACAIATVACSPVAAGPSSKAAAPAGEVHAISGLRIIPLTVSTASGKHVFRVEVADTPAAQEQGLMFRTRMGADEGMIFPWNPPERTAFWMKNTVISLDIIFVGADHKVLNVAANAVPYDRTPLPSAGPVSGVLELNAGRAAEIGLKPGDLVSW